MVICLNCDKVGIGYFFSKKYESIIIPAIKWRAPANRKVGKLSTPIRIPRYVVPQNKETLANANHAFLVSLTTIIISRQK